jgi:hypothetical protein
VTSGGKPLAANTQLTLGEPRGGGGEAGGGEADARGRMAPQRAAGARRASCRAAAAGRERAGAGMAPAAACRCRRACWRPRRGAEIWAPFQTVPPALPTILPSRLLKPAVRRVPPQRAARRMSGVPAAAGTQEEQAAREAAAAVLLSHSLTLLHAQSAGVSVPAMRLQLLKARACAGAAAACARSHACRR